MCIGSIQRFGQKDGCTTIFVQRVAHKTGSLVCTQGAIVVVHDFKGQLAATEFTSFGFVQITVSYCLESFASSNKRVFTSAAAWIEYRNCRYSDATSRSIKKTRKV